MNEAYVMEKMGEEINLIKDKGIKNLVVKAMTHVAEAFFHEGASSTGKYHPPYAQGDGGLMRHVKAAVYFAKQITPLEMYGLSERQKDLIIAALILHDSCKRGIEFEKSYTVHEHPLLVTNLLDDEELSPYEEMDWEEINDLISSHMGQWVNGRGTTTVLPKPITKEQQIVHLCDYLASRREVDVKIFEEDEAEVTPTLPPRPATDPQKRCVAALINKARKLPTYNPKYNTVEVEDLTVGQAGTLISELKEVLGE